jgi:hypothetical protein
MKTLFLDSTLMAPQPAAGVSRRQAVLGAVVAAAVAPLAGCGGAALFAPFFTFLFDGTVDGQAVSISFQPDAASAGQPRGRFAASSNMTVNNLQEFKFSGTFDGRDMKLDLVAALAPLAARYDGVFTDDNTVSLTTSEPGRSSFVARRRMV